jgi:uncharacterized flavoprotein (TIGR03862 family)
MSPLFPLNDSLDPHQLPNTLTVDVAVIGGGPAGLMAAEVLSQQGIAVHVFDAMPSVGRKFLLAGRGGLNLTHAEPPAAFAARFGDQSSFVAPWLAQWGAQQLRAWAKGLGVETFVGSSGRVFPAEMKAAPLLRAWLQRLRHADSPVQFHMRHRWVGGVGGMGAGLNTRAGVDRDAGAKALIFDSPVGQLQVQAKAVVLALGGGSWSRLGSDGAWVARLQDQGVDVAALRPANCGFDVMGREGAGWTDYFAEKFAGQAFKTVALQWLDAQGRSHYRQGEFVATATGVEGSLVYSASKDLRDVLARDGAARFLLDLLPDRSLPFVQAEVAHPKGARSLSSHLKSRLGLAGIKTALLYELLDAPSLSNPAVLAQAIKALPVSVRQTRPLDEAISSAGGVKESQMNAQLMLTAHPGVFCAGEMLDWEAPTGGYLLNASMASGAWVGAAVAKWLQKRPETE